MKTILGLDEHYEIGKKKKVITCILQEKDCFNFKNRKRRNKNQARQIKLLPKWIHSKKWYMLLLSPHQEPLLPIIRYDSISNQEQWSKAFYIFLLNQSSLLLFFPNLKENMIILSLSKFFCTNEYPKSPEPGYNFKLHQNFFYWHI